MNAKTKGSTAEYRRYQRRSRHYYWRRGVIGSEMFPATPKWLDISWSRHHLIDIPF